MRGPGFREPTTALARIAGAAPPRAPWIPPRRGRAGEVVLSYDETGGSRVPLVLLHGYCGSRFDFAEVRGDLARERRVIAVDQRGHGTSDRRAPYSVARLMRDLEAFLDALGEDEVDLLGHSMGGMVALRFALSRPRRVRALVLMSTTADPYPLEPLPVETTGLGRVQAGLRRALGRDVATRIADSLRAPAAVRRRFASTVRFGHDHVDPVAVRELADDLGRMPALGGELARYPGPSLVVVGSEDDPFVEPCRALVAGLPQGRLRVVEGAGHYPHFEAREEWLVAIRGFLGEAGSVPRSDDTAGRAPV